jgi:hypothetical protein
MKMRLFRFEYSTFDGPKVERVTSPNVEQALAWFRRERNCEILRSIVDIGESEEVVANKEIVVDIKVDLSQWLESTFDMDFQPDFGKEAILDEDLEDEDYCECCDGDWDCECCDNLDYGEYFDEEEEEDLEPDAEDYAEVSEELMNARDLLREWMNSERAACCNTEIWAATKDFLNEN